MMPIHEEPGEQTEDEDEHGPTDPPRRRGYSQLVKRPKSLRNYRKNRRERRKSQRRRKREALQRDKRQKPLRKYTLKEAPDRDIIIVKFVEKATSVRIWYRPRAEMLRRLSFEFVFVDEGQVAKNPNGIYNATLNELTFSHLV